MPQMFDWIFFAIVVPPVLYAGWQLLKHARPCHHFDACQLMIWPPLPRNQGSDPIVGVTQKWWGM